MRKNIINYSMMKRVNSNMDNEQGTSESDNTETDNSIIEKEEFDPLKTFQRLDLCLYKKINRFYNNECTDDNKNKMIQIINGTSSISLRILDWFVTKFSKQRQENITVENNDVVDVRISYKTQLGSYRKKNLDPFRRRRKFIYTLNFKNNDKIEITTTLGQLNFFKWAFTENIISYVDTNLKTILCKMNEYNKEDKKKKMLKNEVVTEPIITNKNIKVKATKSITQDNVKLVITFD
jgi:hypothetical protein